MRTIALLTTALLTACATLVPLQAGEEIAIAASRDSQPALVIRVTNERVADYGGSGGMAGAGVGALAGLSCGPLAVFCVPVFMAGLAVSGAGAGALAGVATGARAETRDALQARLEHLARARDPDEHVTAMIRDKAGEHWKVVETAARQSLAVRVGQVSLHTRGEDDVALSVAVLVSLATLDERGDRIAQERWFHSATPGSAASAWHDDEFVTRSLDYVYEVVARNVVSHLSREE
jgi:hypothetical protein